MDDSDIIDHMNSLIRAVRRMLVPALLGTLLFVGGYAFGVLRAGGELSYDGPPLGVINADMPSEMGGVATATEITLCTDKDGVTIPCVVNRDDTEAQVDTPADFAQFWKAWNIINERYVPTKHAPVTNQDKLWGAISGLANSLGDPYTYFLPPQEKTLFEQEVSGAFGGVGMQIGMKDGLVTVIAPVKGSPADRAGVLKGDKVYRVDGATTTDMTLDKTLYLIRGEIGKPVHLTLLREGRDEPIELTLIREEIQVPNIETEKREDVFIIRLFGFPANGAELFRNALKEFADSGATRLIVDLRGNPGGYLEVSVDMASWFLPEGKLIVSEVGKHGAGEVYRSRGYHVFGDAFKFVILVDGGSASAAEILAGALQQHGVATLVGTKTFGKGSVQELVPVTDSTSLKVTVARWVTPNGTNLSEGGLTPDIVVEVTKEQVEKGEDPQLERALSVVRGL